MAETFGGAQVCCLFIYNFFRVLLISFSIIKFYIGCAQVNVTNGGDGQPGPLVSIPGVYTGYEPGILISKLNYLGKGDRFGDM